MAECNVTVELRGDRRRLRRVATAVLRSPLPRTRFPPLRLAHCFFEEPFGGFFYFTVYFKFLVDFLGLRTVVWFGNSLIVCPLLHVTQRLMPQKKKRRSENASSAI